VAGRSVLPRRIRRNFLYVINLSQKPYKRPEFTAGNRQITGLVVYRAFADVKKPVRKKPLKNEKKLRIAAFWVLTFHYQTGRVMADRQSRKFGSMLS
jgi:hypothetical protein